MAYDPVLAAKLIEQYAPQFRVDPRTALAVARSEGLEGYVGDQGSSFGPFQLHYGGVAPGGNRVPGLGDEFTRRTGLDARDPSSLEAQIRFSLGEAAKHGWGPWHGWKGNQWAGIKAEAPPGLLSSTPVASQTHIPPPAPTPLAPMAPSPAAVPTQPAGMDMNKMGQYGLALLARGQQAQDTEEAQAQRAWQQQFEQQHARMAGLLG